MAAVALDVQLADIVPLQNGPRVSCGVMLTRRFRADARRPWGWGFLKAWGYPDFE